MTRAPTGCPTVVFCGGSGTASFAPALARALRPAVFVVNAYDDGRSTGRIRRHLGILGPSDMAKLMATLVANDSSEAIQRCLRRRLPVDVSYAEGRCLLLDATRDPGLCLPIRTFFQACLHEFLLAIEQSTATEPFGMGDLAIRNAVLVGAARMLGGYQAALDHLRVVLDMAARVVVISEQPAHLVAVLEDGHILSDEASICDGAPRARVWRTHLLREALDSPRARTYERIGDPGRASATLSDGAGPSIVAAPGALAAISEADVAVYAPGTLYSSLIPTLALAAPELCGAFPRAILIANLVQENDAMTVSSTVQAVARACTGYGGPVGNTTDISAWVTDVIVQEPPTCCPSLAPGHSLPLGVPSALDHVRLLFADVSDHHRPHLHDAGRLLAALHHAARVSK